MSPSEDKPKQPITSRYWIFGDYHADSHDFVEGAMRRAPKEVACAAAASALVSPAVAIIDKAIVQDIAANGGFFKVITNATVDALKQPKTFFGGLAFRLTFAVYFGTYAVANLAELALDINKIRGDEERKQLKVAASAVANISLLAWRDSIFAREFAASGGAAKPAAPWRTVGLFAVRDTATMYATFYAAPKAATYLQKEHGVERNASELSMAIAIPVVAQIITAPVHIHAIDYYAKPNATTAERWAAIRHEFGSVSFARGFRILPAFGIGSFSNNKFRELFIKQTNEDLLLRRRVTVALENGRRRLTKMAESK
jgi:hypothetical protein